MAGFDKAIAAEKLQTANRQMYAIRYDPIAASWYISLLDGRAYEACYNDDARYARQFLDALDAVLHLIESVNDVELGIETEL